MTPTLPQLTVLAAAILLLGGSCPPATADVIHTTLPQGIAFVTSVEGIHEYQLDNGLRVLLYPDASQATATVNITYFVGSAHEAYGETGMAHLLEHLVFKGSTSHPDIAGELTAHGCRPNGTTWTDRTNYFETFNATRQNLEWALDLEADRMLNSFIAKEDLDSEMTVVRNEFESGENSPLRVLEERVYATAYVWHNYGNTTIGARSDIENVPIDRLQAFYKRWYRPDNSMLVVAGKFDPDWTLEMIQQKFGSLANPDTPLEPLYTAEPAQDGERLVTLRRVGDTQAVAFGYHIPAGTHADYPALAVLNFLLTDTPSGQLHKGLVESGKAASVRGQADRFQAPGLLFGIAELREDQSIAEAETAMREVMATAATNTPTQAELDRARTALLRNWKNSLRDTRRSAIRLSEWASMGDWRSMFLHRDRLEAVTAEDVARVASTYLQDTNRTIGRFIATDEPMRVQVPEALPLAEQLAGYTGREALAAGEALDATPSAIEARIERLTLASGLDVVLLPKETRGDKIELAFDLYFGTAESLRGKQMAGSMAGHMLMRGTTSRTRQDIEDEIARLDASLRITGGVSWATVRLEVPAANFDPAIELVADILKNPAFDAAEFEQLRSATLLEYESQLSEPRSKSWTRLWRHLTPWPADHPLYTATPAENRDRLAALDIADVVAFHGHFYSASAGNLVVVGDFDRAATQPRLEEHFAVWISPSPWERLVTHFEGREALIEQIPTPDKESAVMAAGVRIELNEDDPEYPAMVLGNYMTGGGFLSSRLATRIRQQEGISYGIGSRLSATAIPEVRNGRFTVFAIYAPENDARIMQCLREELERIATDGFSAEEVAEAKSGWLQRRVVSRSDEGELAGTLSRRQHDDRTLAWDEALESSVADLTPAQINEAFRRHITFDKLSVIRAGDFEDAESELSAGTP